jgi:hypothetical protein
MTEWKEQPVEKGGAGSGNFGHAGRPGEIGGSIGGGGRGAAHARDVTGASEAAVDTARFFERVSEPDGGFSVNPITGSEPSGAGHYAVSTFPKRGKVFDGASITPDDLYNYMRGNMAVLSKPDAYFGGWRDPETGKVYLDISRVTTDKAQAESLARRYNQIAYFDFGAGASVKVHHAQS